jgi:hypothetical protein
MLNTRSKAMSKKSKLNVANLNSYYQQAMAVTTQAFAQAVVAVLVSVR